MIVTYAILVGGGLLIAWELRLLGLVLGFMGAWALFLAIALSQVPDHCMVASWHVTPLCGRDLWVILVTSPEVLIFALFMIPDPRTVPEGQVQRLVFGIVVAMLAVLLVGPTTLEFWTKTAILSSLVIACALRFALVAFLAPFVEQGRRWIFGGFRWQVPAAVAIALLSVGALPVAADLGTHSPQPYAELPDGTFPKVTLTVGTGPATASWVSGAASAGLPPAGNTGPASASARVWILPAYPAPTIAPNVHDYDSSVTPKSAAKMAHDVVFDLIVESEARRSHDFKLAQSGAADTGLAEFDDVIKQDIAAGKIIEKSYIFDRIDIQLFLPKFSSQGARLVGISLHGTSTLITRDASGNVLSKTTSPYAKIWGFSTGFNGPAGNLLIYVDYTGLTLAP
jgi:hypothetical protein